MSQEKTHLMHVSFLRRMTISDKKMKLASCSSLLSIWGIQKGKSFEGCTASSSFSTSHFILLCLTSAGCLSSVKCKLPLDQLEYYKAKSFWVSLYSTEVMTTVSANIIDIDIDSMS